MGIAWQGGKRDRATLRPGLGRPRKVRCSGKVIGLATEAGYRLGGRLEPN